MSASGFERCRFDRQVDGGWEFFEYQYSGPKCAEGCVAGSYLLARKSEGRLGPIADRVQSLGRPGAITAVFVAHASVALFPPLVHFNITHEQCGLRRHHKIRIRKLGGGLQLAADIDELALVRWIDPVRIALDHEPGAFVERARDLDRHRLVPEQHYR